MGSRAYSNQEALEGNVTTTETTLTLARPSRRVEIINDSNTKLLYKFNASENFATLFVDEAISMEMWVRQIILKAESGSADYRVRVQG